MGYSRDNMGDDLRALMEYADQLGIPEAAAPPRGTQIVIGGVHPPPRREPPTLSHAEAVALGLPEPEVDAPIEGLWPPDALDPLPFWERPAWWPPVRDPTARYSKRRNLRGWRIRDDTDDVC